MKDKIWSFADKKAIIKTPYEYLMEYASRLGNDTGGIVEGIVTETTSDAETVVTYALYLVVPQLRNYSYRLIEVTQPNAFTPYPVTMKLFGKVEGNILVKKDISAKNFEKNLLDFIQNPLTRSILTHLKTHLDIRNKFRIGEARVATLKTGKKINIGIVEIKDDNVFCLTGNGLREMYKPRMSADEEAKAIKLRKLSYEEKIKRNLMVKLNFNDFQDIE